MSDDNPATKLSMVLTFILSDENVFSLNILYLFILFYSFFFFLLICEVSEQSSYYALLKQIPLQTNWLHATLNTLYSFDLSAKDVICDLSSLDRVLYSVQLPFTPSCFCPRNVKVTYCYLQALKPT